MIDKVLRKPKETIFSLFVRGPLRHVHPTMVTLLAALVGVLAGVAAWQAAYPIAIGLWLMSRVLDGLDGTLARLTNQQSDLGAYLDVVLDHVVYIAVPLGLAAAIHTTEAYIALVVLLASFYLNAASWMYLAALLEKRSAGATTKGELTGITMPTGLVEGAETIAFYSLFLLFPVALVPLFACMAVLVFATVGQRLVWAVRNL